MPKPRNQKANIVEFPGQKPAAPQPEERFKLRADGRYQVEHRYLDADGKKQKKSFYGKTQTEALAKRRAFVRDLEAGLRVDKGKANVSKYIDVFLKTYKPTVKHKTYTQKVYDMEIIREEIGDVLLRNVTKTTAQNVLNVRAGMSTEYIKKLKVSLNQLFDSAAEDRYILFNPCAKLTLPKGTYTPHRELTDDERRYVRACDDHRFTGLVWSMMFAGLRPSEAAGLRIEDVDFGLSKIHVTEAIVFEGHKKEVSDLKSEASHRSVPLVEPLRGLLQKAIGDRDEGRVFLTEKKNEEMTASSFRRGMQSYLYHLGIIKNGFRKRWTPEGKTFEDVHFTPYDLRHTFCTMLYDAGVDIKTAVEWMGHADAQLTLKIYTHLSQIRKARSTSDYETYAKSVGQSVGHPLNIVGLEAVKH